MTDSVDMIIPQKPQIRQLNIFTSYRKSEEAARKGFKPLLNPQLIMAPPAKDNNGQEATEEGMHETKFWLIKTSINNQRYRLI